MPYSRNTAGNVGDRPDTPYRLGPEAIKRWTITLGTLMAVCLIVPLLIDAIWGPLPSDLLDFLGVVAVAGILAPLAVSAVVGGYAVGPYGGLAGALLGAGIALLVLGLPMGSLWAALGGLGLLVIGTVGLLVVGKRNKAHMWIRLGGVKFAERNAPGRRQ